MADRLRSIDPLRHDVPIVDVAGRPTPQFARQWMQTRSVDEAVSVTSDSLASFAEEFAEHGHRHHAGGDLALDLDSIGGMLNGSKLFGDVSVDSITAADALLGNTTITGFFDIPAGTSVNGFTWAGAASDPPFADLPSGSALNINFNSDLLGGQHGPFYLDRANHSGTQGWATIDKTGSSLADLATRSATDLSTGTLVDGRLSSNVPLKNTSSTYTASQIFQRTASNLLAIRFSTAAGAYTEIMVDGSYAMGVGGSPRDLRHRRTGAGVLEIDNNAGGAAELDVTGYGLFGGTTISTQAVLEARSTARGFLPPRMTTVQRDAISAIPVAGLTVYNTTTSKLQTWDGTVWQDHW